MMSDSYKFGDIILLKFPFTDGQKSKKRHALILLDTNDQDIIVCRITSQLYSSSFDVSIKNWVSCGLKSPSVIRVHKIASLEKNMLDKKLGQISKPTQLKIKNVFSKILI